jgi:hypothetical protein
MLKWIGIVLGTLVVLATVGYVRHTSLPRRRVRRFLHNRGIDFVCIKRGFSYAWPSYIVVFDSLERSTAFLKSSYFGELVREVQKMHGDLSLNGARFDAAKAIGVQPVVIPSWE